MRTSLYVIYVELSKIPDEVIIMHGYTGASDKISRQVYDYLLSKDLRHKHSRNDDENSSSVSSEAMDMLLEKGYLTHLSEQDEVDKLSGEVAKLHSVMLRQSPVYLFMPTYDCNLRCFYCFQDGMRSDALKKKTLKLMSRDAVDTIFKGLPTFDALHGLADNPDAERNIGFFGGEPLLAENKPIVEYIMKKAKELGKSRFWSVTNGTELHHFGDLLGPGGIEMIQITLDGIPEEHDKRRIYPNGEGSFEQIEKNIEFSLDKEIKVQIRVNVDFQNVGDLPILAKIIQQHGWDQRENFSIYAYPISTCDDETNKLNRMSTWKLHSIVTELTDKHPEMAVFCRPDMEMKERVKRTFNKGKGCSSLFKTSFCSAHDRMYVFDAFANIYACWERTGDAQERIGKIHENGDVESNRDMLLKWRTRTSASNPVCQKCRYLLCCGGGCAIAAEAAHSKFFGNYCDDFSRRFRHAAEHAYYEHLSDQDQTVASD